MKKVKNLIFDLGGVVIDLARENAVAALSALGIEGVDDLLGLYRQKEPFLSLETGGISEAEFYDEIRKMCKKDVSDMDIQNAFNAFLVKLPVERLAALRRLREEGYKVFGLSNTNPVMFNSWIRDAFMQEGLKVNDYFDGLVLSFEEGFCKPEPELFATVLNRYGLDPQETVMLDDSKKNCEAAESLGMRSACVGKEPDSDIFARIEEIRECNRK